MYPRKGLYSALARLQQKLDELTSAKDDNWYRQYYTLHKADPKCPYLGPVSDQLKAEFIEQEIKELIKEYDVYSRSK